METLTLTAEDAHNLKSILVLFNDTSRLLVREGSLTIENVTLEWNKDIIRVSIQHTPPINHSQEG